MEIIDKEIEELDLKQPRDVMRIINALSGQERLPSKSDMKFLVREIGTISRNRLGLEQINEIMLILNQIRLGGGFFRFFFEPSSGTITSEQFKKGVTKFRGYAVLCYANFRFAFRKWVEMNEKDILEDIKGKCCLISETVVKGTKRRPSVLKIKDIEKNRLYYLGYLSSREIRRNTLISLSILYRIDKNQIQLDKYTAEEREFILENAQSLNKTTIEKWKPKIYGILRDLRVSQNDMLAIQRTGVWNTNIYLAWDYIDVYVATSMREKWEFEDAFDFIKHIFGHRNILRYKLRYFDPTQSWVPDRVQKGLIEALMLKRTKLTLYLAQETDSLGKDSELAITLAQGKPVVAYIPEINAKEHARKIFHYPLLFFRKRLSLLDAENALYECKVRIDTELGNGTYEQIKVFKEELEKYYDQKIFVYNEDEENEFKSGNLQLFQTTCRVLGIVESYYFDRRSDLLKKSHPLGLQVNLETGVANGVIVVRSVQQCTQIMERILSDKMQLIIENDENGIVLKESITNSFFRVVTNNEKLTNSFWSFYLRK